MAAESRTPSPDLDNSPLEEALRNEPFSFEFFQAVTLLQRLAPQLQPVGRFSNPDDEAVRFRGNTSLGFPASQIQQIEWPEDGPPRMMVNFMG
ncbi:MAG TPA: type VI secretion system baseplate subunit TssG, partial [Chthoniobacteraceae bacterium]